MQTRTTSRRRSGLEPRSASGARPCLSAGSAPMPHARAAGPLWRVGGMMPARRADGAGCMPALCRVAHPEAAGLPRLRRRRRLPRPRPRPPLSGKSAPVDMHALPRQHCHVGTATSALTHGLAGGGGREPAHARTPPQRSAAVTPPTSVSSSAARTSGTGPLFIADSRTHRRCQAERISDPGGADAWFWGTDDGSRSCELLDRCGIAVLCGCGIGEASALERPVAVCCTLGALS